MYDGLLARRETNFWSSTDGSPKMYMKGSTGSTPKMHLKGGTDGSPKMHSKGGTGGSPTSANPEHAHEQPQLPTHSALADKPTSATQRLTTSRPVPPQDNQQVNLCHSKTDDLSDPIQKGKPS